MNIQLNPVKSSNIAAIGYDEPTKTLVVLFHNGRSYSYESVEKDVYFELYNADSVGSHFAKNIKPHYTCKQL